MLKLFKSFAPEVETLDLFKRVINSGYMAEGPMVKDFEDKLKHVINMDLNKKNKLNNLISINRAKWLMSNTKDYFLE